MNSEELQLFARTYESHSFSEAATKVYKSPQGVAKTIARLEAELKVPLFKRQNTGIVPTAFGDRLYQNSRAIEAIFNDIQTTGRSSQTFQKEIVNVFATMGFLDIIGFEFWEPFYQQHPELILNLVEFPDSALQQRIDDHQTNLAFVSESPNFAEMTSTFMMTNDYQVLMAPDSPLAKEKIITPDLLTSVPQAMMGQEYTALSHYLESVQVQSDVNLNQPILETSNVTYIIEFALRHLGIGILQSFRFLQPPIFDLLTTGKLITHPLSFKLNRNVFFVSRETSALTTGEQLLKDYIIKQKATIQLQNRRSN